MLGLLNIAIIIPIFGAMIIGIVAKNTPRGYRRSRKIGLFFQIISLIISGIIYKKFDVNIAGFQLEEKYHISNIINYHLAIDGISLPFLLLTNILMPCILLGTWEMVQERVKEYVIFFLMMQGLIIGSFVAVDLIIFYFFFEFMLIPMYLIIGIWGGENRVFAAIKFFLYTFAGSILLLASIIYLYSKIGNVDFYSLKDNINGIDIVTQKWIILAFFISFAIKVPMWPLHTWLPDAHVQAPTGGSMVLAGILLKIGGYAMLRFLLPIFPGLLKQYSSIILDFSLIAIIYASFVAFAQRDMKKLIAYSSVAHMGYVTAGIFSGNIDGLHGAMIQMISHGLISAGLFLVVGIIYDRCHTKQMEELGGIAKSAPNLAIMAMFLTMASVALPGTSGFVGEFLTLIGLYKYSFLYSALGALGVILGASYMLLLYRQVFYGNKVQEINDINKYEFGILILLVIMVLLIGIYPSLITKITNQSLVSLI